MCNYSGYELVALIPIRTDKVIFGLIQMNDPRKNMFTLQEIKNYEAIAESVGSIVSNAFEIQKRMNDVFELVNKFKSH